MRLESDLHPLLVQMLTDKNDGLKEVTHLTTRFGDAGPRDIEEAVQHLEIVFDAIPKDNLRAVRFETASACPAPRVIRSLWQRQAKLQILEICPTADDGDEYVDLASALGALTFPDLRAVRAVLQKPEHANTARVAIQKGRLSELAIDATLWYDPEIRKRIDENGDFSIEEERFDIKDTLTGFLFHSLQRLPSDHVDQLNRLRSLGLKDVDLEYCEYTWFRFIDFTLLQHLKIEYCRCADSLLLQLRDGITRLPLQSFCLVHEINRFSDGPDPTVNHLETILFRSDTIESLELCLRHAPRLLDTRCLLKLGHTLQRLLIDVWPGPALVRTNDDPRNPFASAYFAHRPLVYDNESFFTIAEGCPLLRELGLAFPTVNLQYTHAAECQDFFACIGATAKLLHLTTLNIHTWPLEYETPQARKQDARSEADERALQRLLARDVFSRHRLADYDRLTHERHERHSKLDVVAFGIREHKKSSAIRPLYFNPVEIISEEEPELIAKRVELTDLQLYGFNTEVLEYEPRTFSKRWRSEFGLELGGNIEPFERLHVTPADN